MEINAKTANKIATGDNSIFYQQLSKIFNNILRVALDGKLEYSIILDHANTKHLDAYLCFTRNKLQFLGYQVEIKWDMLNNEYVLKINWS